MPKLTRTENRYAVCIGINKYHSLSGLSELHYAENDARAMDDLLGHLGFAQEHRCLLTGESATLEAINEALAEFILDRPGENDLVVFYFAGHSLPLTINERETQNGAEPRSEVFLTTYDFDSKKIKQSLSFRKQSALSMERLRKDFFEGEGSRKRLFLFDSCYSGDFYGPHYRDENDPVQGYIKHMLDSNSMGRVALSSCLPIQKATEDATLGHGRFTYYLLEALSGRALEALRRDGYLTVNSLFEYLAKKLPYDQRPVLSGVQQDTFDLVCYPEKVDKLLNPLLEDTEDIKHVEREVRLQALIADHSGFMRDRLESFVGRQRELEEISERITEKLSTGGYVTITGQAGQGKSSIIARLVQKYASENVASHFIPFNPGPDHQVGLLRNVMARLILKHHLSELYVASESRAALRDYFPKVLHDLVAKGEQEVIFIDGLDQLEEDFNGSRDLSFLPNDPPPGVVFVLGTRPNDTLRPLELLKPHSEYTLPNLSRSDFDLILQHRQVHLDRSLADQFYKAMQENALYLDLVAKELVERGDITPSEIIRQIADNPENLFSFSMARLKRQAVQWREVIKPIFGVLLAAREPLTRRHIRQIINVDEEQLNDGLERLGGLVADDGRQRYYLFHLKLQDFLQQDENNPTKKYIFATDEVEKWHSTLAAWCEQGNLSRIWSDAVHNAAEQGRREYARKHYITHLYYAREWEQLFHILDTGDYGRAKVRHDPSMRSYVQDLDIGRQAATWSKWTMSEAVSLLPRLWQYTLLRCSLTSRADSYPLEGFEALASSNREKEVLDLAELLTSSSYKVKVLLLLAKYMGKQPILSHESMQILFRACEVANSISNSEQKAEALEDLGQAMADIGQWEQAETLICAIEGAGQRAIALGKLSKRLGEAYFWEKSIAMADEALVIAYAIAEEGKRSEVLRVLSLILAEAKWWDRVEEAILSMASFKERLATLKDFCLLLVQAKQWKYAEVVARLIAPSQERVEALSLLCKALREADLPEQASAIREEAIATVHIFENAEKRVEMWSTLGETLDQGWQHEQAEEIWDEAVIAARSITEVLSRATVLEKLGISLARSQQWERAEAVAYSTMETERIGRVLREISRTLIEAQQWDRAEVVVQSLMLCELREEALEELSRSLAIAQQWKHSLRIASYLVSVERSSRVLGILSIELAKVNSWERAEAITHSIVLSEQREQTLQELSKLLIETRQWEQAEKIARSIKEVTRRVAALRELGKALTQAQHEHAEAVWDEVINTTYTIKPSGLRAEELRELSYVLAETLQWNQAQSAAEAIVLESIKAETLQDLSQMLIAAKQWERAEIVARSIKVDEWRVATLQKLGMALAWNQQWDRAIAIWDETKSSAYFIADIERRGSALQGLCAALAEAQEWKRARDVTHSIASGRWRIKALQELGMMLTRAQQQEQAYDVWKEAILTSQSITNTKLKAEALQELGGILILSQQWDLASIVWIDAITVTRLIEDDKDRQKALQELEKVLLQSQQWEHAITVTRLIEDDKDRQKALQELGKVLLQSQQWEHAITVTRLIEGHSDRRQALQEMGRALNQSQQWEFAVDIWDEVIQLSSFEEYISSDTYIERLLEALRELSKALFQAQHWERAQSVWEEAALRTFSMRGNYQRSASLRELVWILLQAQQWDSTMAIVRRVEPSTLREALLKEMNEILIQVQQGKSTTEVEEKNIPNDTTLQHWNSLDTEQGRQGQSIVPLQRQTFSEMHFVHYAFQESKWQAEELGALGNTFAEIHLWGPSNELWDEAIAVVGSIQNSYEKAETLEKLAEIASQSEQIERANALWEEAITVSHSIEEQGQKAKVLAKISVGLSGAQLWEQAEKIAHSITEIEASSGALSQLSRALAQAQLWEQAGRVAHSITEIEASSGALSQLSRALAQAQLWEQAETCVHSIALSTLRVAALNELGKALMQAGHWEHAEVLWNEIIIDIRSFGSKKQRAIALSELSKAFAQVGCWDVVAKLWNEALLLAQTTIVGEWKMQFLAQKWKQASTVWKPTGTIAFATQKEKEKIAALRDQSKAFTQVQQWKQAIAVVYSIEERTAKDLALCELGSILAEAQKWDYAIKVWEDVIIDASSIQNDKQKAIVLEELRETLIQVQRREQVAIETHASTKSRWSVEALGTPSQALAQAQLWEQRAVQARHISAKWQQMKALRELGIVFAQVQLFDRAMAIWDVIISEVHAITEKEWKVELLALLGKDLMQAQLWKHAITVWEEVIALNASLEENEWNTEAFDELSKALAQTQQWDQAEEVARSIQRPIQRNKILSELSCNLARAQQWERAEKIARSIPEIEYSSRALSELSQALGQAQQWDRARVLADSVTLSKWRTIALSELSQALGQAQQWEHAEKIARSIPEIECSSRALSELSQALGQAQQWEHAEKIARIIPKIECSSRALSELSQALGQAQQWDYAEKIAHSIMNDRWRVTALSELGKILLQMQQGSRAEVLWEAAIKIAYSTEEKMLRIIMFKELGKTFAQVQQWKQATVMWNEATLAAYSTVIKLKADLIEVLDITPQLQWEGDGKEEYTFYLNNWSAEIQAELSRALVRAYLWDEASQVAHAIIVYEAKMRALRELGKALIEAGQRDRAETVWAAIINMALSKQEKARVQGEWSKLLAQSEQWDQAIAIIVLIEDDRWRQEALRELGRSLAQMQQWSQVEVVLRLIAVEWQAIVLRELGKLLSLKQRNDFAEIVWDRATETASSIVVHSEFSTGLDEEGRISLDAHLMKRAAIATYSIVANGQTADISIELSTILIQAYKWDQAEAIIYSLVELRVRAEALERFWQALTLAKQWRWARDVSNNIDTLDRFLILSDLIAHTLQEPFEAVAKLRQEGNNMLIVRSKGLDNWTAEIQAELSRSLVRAHLWDEATQVADAIIVHEVKMRALCELGKALMGEGQRDRAETVWTAIINMTLSKQEKAQIQGEWSKLLARSEQWDQAETAAQDIEENEEKEKALSELGRCLVQSQQWDRAEVVVQSITLIDLKIEALRTLGKALFQAEKQDQALAILDVAIVLIRTNRSSTKLLEEDQASAIYIQSQGSAMNRVDFAKKDRELLYPSRKGEELSEVIYLREKLSKEIHQRSDFRKLPSRFFKQWKEAEELRELGKKLSLGSLGNRSDAIWNAALVVTRSLVLPYSWQITALKELAKALTEAQQLQLADEVWQEVIIKVRERQGWERIEHLGERIEYLLELGTALVEVQKWEYAVMLWDDIINEMTVINYKYIRSRYSPENDYDYKYIRSRYSPERAYIRSRYLFEGEILENLVYLRDAVELFIRTKYWKHVEKLVMKFASDIKGESGYLIEIFIKDVLDILDILENEQQNLCIFNILENIVAVFDDENSEERVPYMLISLGNALAQARRWDYAKVIVYAIKGVQRRVAVLQKLGLVFYQTLDKESVAELWDSAITAIRSVQDIQQRAKALLALGATLCKLQEVEQAIKVWIELIRAAQFTDHTQRSEIFRVLSMTITEMQEWKCSTEVWFEFITVISSITESNQRTELLRAIGKVSSQIQLWEHTVDIWIETAVKAQSIEESQLILENLINALKNLKEEGEQIKLLYLVQRIWLQANTREYALAVLPIVGNLISLKPEIGTAFCDAFAEVDAFLKG